MGKIAQFGLSCSEYIGYWKAIVPVFFLTALFSETLDNIMLTSTLATERFPSLSWDGGCPAHWRKSEVKPLHPVGTHTHDQQETQVYNLCDKQHCINCPFFSLSFPDSSAVGCFCSSCRWIKALYSLYTLCSVLNLHTDILQIVSA